MNSTTTTSSSNATTDALTGQAGGVCCWETVVGQELFKLAITYFGAELAVIAFADCLRFVIVKIKLIPHLIKRASNEKLKKVLGWLDFGLAEFNIAENILKLLYGQALVW